ncbi:RxLR effector protein [Phytophthora megakarya]|uniref:RxLR effector protein n=1 Tax=Phytophthora megakarya TaxID=4795 RepID=A0A225V726_9STRA|nr:RxLR effector protein [Phytophthora megakarya]
MRISFVLMLSFFASKGAAEWTASNVGPTKISRTERDAVRLLRSYGMEVLDKKDNGRDEERGTIDISKLDDALTSKLDDLLSSDKIGKALKNLGDQETLFKTWYADETTSKAVLARLKKLPAEDIANKNILEKYKGFIKKEREFDDLVSADKIEKALKTVDDQKALFKTWYVDEATSKAVLARLQKTPDEAIANKDILSSYQAFRITRDEEIDDLVSADKIKNAMKSLDNQETLFKSWHTDEGTSNAVRARLMQSDKRAMNLGIIIKYDDFRTRNKFNTVLDGWLDSKTLDEMAEALEVVDKKRLAEQFGIWYSKGVAPEKLSSAINKVANKAKQKRLGAINFFYKVFVQDENKKAAAKKVEDVIES